MNTPLGVFSFLYFFGNFGNFLYPLGFCCFFNATLWQGDKNGEIT